MIALITDNMPTGEAFCDNRLALSDSHDEQVQIYEKLTKLWGNKMEPGVMNNSTKRLLLFTPNVSTWHMIIENWSNSVLVPINGCSYQFFVNAIVNCIG